MANVFYTREIIIVICHPNGTRITFFNKYHQQFFPPISILENSFYSYSNFSLVRLRYSSFQTQ